MTTELNDSKVTKSYLSFATNITYLSCNKELLQTNYRKIIVT